MAGAVGEQPGSAEAHRNLHALQAGRATRRQGQREAKAQSRSGRPGPCPGATCSPPLPPAAGCTAAFRSPSPPGAARAPARHAQLNVGHVGRGPRKGGPSEWSRQRWAEAAAGPTCSARRLPRPESLLCFVLLNLSVWCCIKSTVRELLPGRSS